MSAVLAESVRIPQSSRHLAVTHTQATRPHLRLVHDADADAAPPVHVGRLSRRGEIVVRVLAGVLAVALAVLVGAGVGLVLRPAAPIATDVTTVETGDSLWSVAAAVAAPGQDPREVVAEIVQLNDLTSDVVVPGQRLLVPLP